MVTIRAARRSRWRLVGGRLIVGDVRLRFESNGLERRWAAGDWSCSSADVTGVRRRGRFWLVIETGDDTETFRVFGAGAAQAKMDAAQHPASTGGD